LQWKMLVYFMDTWSVLRPFVIFYGHFGNVRGNLVHFFPFWYFVRWKIWQPCTRPRRQGKGMGGGWQVQSIVIRNISIVFRIEVPGATKCICAFTPITQASGSSGASVPNWCPFDESPLRPKKFFGQSLDTMYVQLGTKFHTPNSRQKGLQTKKRLRLSG
jgi:hypothetical protein